MEWFFIGCMVGFIFGSISGQWSVNSDIRYKARTGIRMALRGRFYEIKDLGNMNDD